MSRAVMQQALEALMMMRDKYEEYACPACDHADAAITALRQALAEPEQEPVAWVEPKWLDPDTRGWPIYSFESVPIEGWLPLYTAPTPRKPVELTDPEVDDLTMTIRNAYPLIETPFYVWCRHFSRAVIAAYEAKQGEQHE